MTNGKVTSDAAILSWPGRLLSADDLRRHLSSQREIVVAPATVVTPLALDELRGWGVRLRREEAVQQASGRGGGWGYALEMRDGLVEAAVEALRRQGTALVPLAGNTPLEWAKAALDCGGGIVFCADAGLVCCIANKLKGVRAVAVAGAGQAARARKTLAANLLAVEMPGRTLFELRQIIRAALGQASCPPEVAQTLQELDGHAHR
jgi:hypothetical protein